MWVMGFSELLQQLQSGDEGLPATIYDDLRAEYNQTSENADAKIAEQSSRIEYLEAEVSRLKAANYDLVSANPTPGSDEGDESPANDEMTIDSLFGKE